jgi:hypothetical protein
VLKFLWKSSAGYRLRPWRSPYLRWRIETYWGWHADQITARNFFRFGWERRRDLRRFLKWAAQMPPEVGEKGFADRIY